MSNIELHRPIGTRLPAQARRSYNLAVAEVVAATKLAATKTDAEAALAGRIMERVVDIDTYRRSLAGNDETLNAILLRVEMNFIDTTTRLQRNFASDWL